MTDLSSYHLEVPGLRPDLMDEADLRSSTSTCRCHVCLIGNKNGKTIIRPKFIEYTGSISVETTDDLTDEDYFLCPFEIPSFVFKTRTWGEAIPDGLQRDVANNFMMQRSYTPNISRALISMRI